MDKQKALFSRVLSNGANILQNALLSRAALLRKWLDPQRNIALECGHPIEVGLAEINPRWERGDIAARVVSVLPEETWSQNPEVYETEDVDKTPFEEAWEELRGQFSIWSRMEKADILSGVGRFGVLLLGFDDGKDLSEPILSSSEARKLIYLRPFDENVLEIQSLEPDSRNPRYGLPLQYNITFADTVLGGSTQVAKRPVHWSRIIHLADNRTNSEIFGIPRMKRVFDRLIDLDKIASSSAEMFWKGGFPGLSLESHPQLENVELDTDATKEQMEAYMNGLQRYIATIGMQVRSLDVQVADPRPHIETQLKLIAICLGVPWRIFAGSESAHLASSQDDATWNRRLTQRRQNYVTPYVIRPFVDRLIEVGVLPKPKSSYKVWWPDLNTPSDEQRSKNAQALSDALSKYIQAGGDAVLPPYYYLTIVLGLEDEEALAIMEAAQKQIDSGELLATVVGGAQDAQNGAVPPGRQVTAGSA